MAFTQTQVLNLAEHGAEVVADILDNSTAYTAEQVAMARQARSIRIARGELEIERRMVAFDNA